ncbi:MAG: tRNA (N(6)-L-threonylcarbamoyladenosine(37)-C(2))-methylthiotransferase MtaB [Hyphomicrobiaceae bacterium]|nr:MAG: tRNA (N(6)-L-threonylcarbamoyladenosine(37)-C(2))-methylthiotransferase MtaB [Hyphomicrobiaceae bacterium]
MSLPRVISFGCRLNSVEGNVMAAHARAAGLKDAVIVNSCAVTQEAVRQGQQSIRRMRRENPSAKLIATGCAVQTDPKRFAAMGEIDNVIGNAEKLDRAAWLRLADNSASAPRVDVGEIMQVTTTASHMVAAAGSRSRAFLEVQNGCDHRCTFCIIPFGRGPSRSVPASDVIDGARRLVDAGHIEIVLTGVDITSYGADLSPRLTLGSLVRRLLREVKGLTRLRLSSIDQVEADPELMRAIAEEDRLMPHLHLSLQAGSDMILKRMRRRHLRADAIKFCEDARRLRPDIAFGADLIAGFPTETEEMFAASERLVDDCGLTFLHVFPFSARPGTPAARMPQLDRALVRERAGRLREKGAAALARHLHGEIGKVRDVLAEQPSCGRTPQFAEVRLQSPLASGTLAQVRVMGVEGARLVGSALE